MKLYIETSALGSAGQQVQAEVNQMSANINRQVLSRGTRAVNEMRNAELEVMRGMRSGKVYKKPGTDGKRANKATRTLMKDYGHKLNGGQLYRASAPGEPPASRTGNLRMHWSGDVRGSGSDFTLCIESGEKYAGYLEGGTKKMAARPFKDRIIEKAMPGVKAIFSEPYN